jgi:macrolide transport system ATP-binding/permease protein
MRSFFCTYVLSLQKGEVFLLLLELKNIVKSVGDRCLFKIDDLKVYSKERIGIVGSNGVGKTTLLKIMAGLMQPDEGKAVQYRCPAYIAQLDGSYEQEDGMNPGLAHEFQIGMQYEKTMSGGEKTRYRLALALSKDTAFLLADEPTANLDIKGTELVQQKLQDFQGAFVIVSHDRELLDMVCTSIWEIQEEEIKVYTGNYRQYLAEKEVKKAQQAREYENYLAEKKKLEAGAADRRQQAVSMRKTPSRMGNSEARLHKMGNQKAKANLYKAVKAMETRISQLEAKDKPKSNPKVVFDLVNTDDLYSKMVLRAEGISKFFGNRRLYDQAEFSIGSGYKVAMVGDNGCGKTTLMNMILSYAEGIYVAPKVRFGYFSQAIEGLDLDKSILANVMTDSIYDENFVRSLLAQLLFRQDDVYKKVAVLSGGERTRVALAQIMVSKANVLLLDEPTNYLDLPSLEALEAVLAGYKGTILLASHDRKFINSIATHLMLFDSGKLRLFSGSYEEYLQYKQEQKVDSAKEGRLLLEHCLAEVLSKLSVAKDRNTIDHLDKEYRELLVKLK